MSDEDEAHSGNKEQRPPSLGRGKINSSALHVCK